MTNQEKKNQAFAEHKSSINWIYNVYNEDMKALKDRLDELVEYENKQYKQKLMAIEND